MTTIWFHTVANFFLTFKSKLKFTKLMIFMQKLQYNAPDLVYGFQKISRVTTWTPFNDGTQNYQLLKIFLGVPSLQNRGCVLKDSINKVMENANEGHRRSWESHGN